MGCGAATPIPVGFFYFMITTFMYIQEENNLLRGSKMCWWLTKSQIEEVLESCINTLEYYNKNNYDNDFINSLNDKIWDEEYNSYNRIKVKKIKTYVYIMIDHNTKYYKIGKSDSPLKREKTLQSEKPTIQLIYYFESYDNDEKILHQKFKDKRIRGEWFNLDENDIEYIKNYK